MTDKGPHSKTLSDVYHLLRAARRRYVVQILSESSADDLSVQELGKQISAIETDVPLEQVNTKYYRSVYNALSQTHLPTLSEYEIIIYDSDRQTVAVGPDFQMGVVFVFLNRVVYYAIQQSGPNRLSNIADALEQTRQNNGDDKQI
jgi:hypothetical protein